MHSLVLKTSFRQIFSYNKNTISISRTVSLVLCITSNVCLLMSFDASSFKVAQGESNPKHGFVTSGMIMTLQHH